MDSKIVICGLCEVEFLRTDYENKSCYLCGESLCDECNSNCRHLFVYQRDKYKNKKICYDCEELRKCYYCDKEYTRELAAWDCGYGVKDGDVSDVGIVVCDVRGCENFACEECVDAHYGTNVEFCNGQGLSLCPYHYKYGKIKIDIGQLNLIKNIFNNN